MIDRAFIKIINDSGPPLYLYTHWGTDAIVNDIHGVLKDRNRWDDSPYLSKSISEKLRKNSVGDRPKFDASNFNPNAWVKIVVNVSNQTISFTTDDAEMKIGFERFVGDPLTLINVLNAVYREPQSGGNK